MTGVDIVDISIDPKCCEVKDEWRIPEGESENKAIML